MMMAMCMRFDGWWDKGGNGDDNCNGYDDGDGCCANSDGGGCVRTRFDAVSELRLVAMCENLQECGSARRRSEAGKPI